MSTGLAEDPLSETTIPPEYAKAFELRQQHFGDSVKFHAPSLKDYDTSEFSCHEEDFVSMSVTGDTCGLSCDHCDGAVLESMIPVDDEVDLAAKSKALAEQGGEGLLLSGGCDSEGQVHLEGYLDGISAADENDLEVALHTGLVPERETAMAYADAGADAAMVDIIGAEETIEQVYNLEDTTPEDYGETLGNLDAAGLKLIPHLVVGLHYGEIRGEERALEIISQYDVHALVLVIMMPLNGTAMTDVEPPAPAEVGDIFRTAREMFPETTIMLGCARPKAQSYSLDVETRALQAGFNGIAFPSDGVIEYSQSLGLEPALKQTCCSL